MIATPLPPEPPRTAARASRRLSLLSLFVSLIVLAIDLASKAAAASGVLAGSWILPLENRALAVGLADGPAVVEILVGAAALALAVIVLRDIVYDDIGAVAAGLILGGSQGNLLDRTATGGVQDFMAGPGVVFNVADVALVVGLTVMLRRRSSRAGRVSNLMEA